MPATASSFEVNMQRVIEQEHISPAGFCVQANATEPTRIRGYFERNKAKSRNYGELHEYDLIFTIEPVIVEYSELDGLLESCENGIAPLFPRFDSLEYLFERVGPYSHVFLRATLS